MRLYPNRQRECVEGARSVRSNRTRRTNPDHGYARELANAAASAPQPRIRKACDASDEAAPLSME